MNVLARHELRHADGRRVFVYGQLDGGAELRAGEETQLGDIHRRLDLLTDEWVVISPRRNIRPNEPGPAEADERPCPICPGGAELPFPYEAAVFENRFPSLVADPPPAPSLGLPTGVARGRCEVVVYTPRHDVSFGGLTAEELGRLLAIWIDRSRELWADESHELVFPFENRGAEAGATLSHPHGQIYAFDHLPPVARTKLATHRRFREANRSCLGCAASDVGDRLVAENESFAVAVPFAPRWPYEVAVRARRHGLGRLADLALDEQVDLMRALRDVALRFDALFGGETPYLMSVQEAPRGEPDWHLAFDFFPLRRSRSATKIRASVETATGLFLNDVLPDSAARRLAEIELDRMSLGPEHLCRVEQAEAEMVS